MVQRKSTEEEWDEGVRLKFGKGGKYDCMNCDWATNDLDKANRHREIHLKALGHKLPHYKIGFWNKLIRD